MPQDCILAAVMRGDEVIAPCGGRARRARGPAGRPVRPRSL